MWFSASEKPGSLQIWDVRWERENSHLATILPYHQWLSSPTALPHLGETLRQRQSVIIPQIVPLHYWIVSQRRLSAVSVGWETCTVIEKSPSAATIKTVIAWAHSLLTFCYSCLIRVPLSEKLLEFVMREIICCLVKNWTLFLLA